MPFCHLELRAPRPDDPGPEPQNFAGAIRWRRKKLGLTQRELAAKLGVTRGTICNWELGHSRPGLRQTPRVAHFLDRLTLFRPGKPLDFPVRLYLARRRLGLSQAELAMRLGVSEGAVWEWENGNHRPRARHRKKLEALFEEVIPAEERDL